MFFILPYNRCQETKNVPISLQGVNSGRFFCFTEEALELNYEEKYQSFLHHHHASRTGERRGRLERGQRHAESLFLKNVWWPLRGSFEALHPEYEVPDWRGRSYFADFAWLPGYVKLLIEIKGYAKHVRDMDRQSYCNELNRETFLYAMGFHVISFAYDDVEQRPNLCVTLLRMAINRFQPEQAPVSRARLEEKEIIRLATQLMQPIRPKDVRQHLDVDYKTAVLILRRLCDKGWLLPSLRGNGKRIVRYELARGVLEYVD
jgi:very-short-patch-repair endonuclease